MCSAEHSAVNIGNAAVKLDETMAEWIHSDKPFIELQHSL